MNVVSVEELLPVSTVLHGKFLRLHLKENLTICLEGRTIKIGKHTFFIIDFTKDFIEGEIDCYFFKNGLFCLCN